MNKKTFLYELKAFLVMLLVITSMRSALADWNDVPTGSMKPTIEEGDRVVVNKLAYDLKVPFTMISLMHWADPQRGDIVVLFSPADGMRLVKRVVAIPGDRLWMRNNQLFVNGEPARWTSVPIPEDDPHQGQTLVVDETLNGRTHKIMLTPHLATERTSIDPIVLPPQRYFVMGDNRDNSRDSRWIGVIERRRIVGKATAVAFSLDRDHHYSPRFGRFFKGLQ